MAISCFEPDVQLAVVAFQGELLDKLLKESRVLVELVSQRLKVLGCRVALKDLRLVFMDQRAELLNAHKDLRDELSDLSFLPAEHRLI